MEEYYKDKFNMGWRSHSNGCWMKGMKIKRKRKRDHCSVGDNEKVGTRSLVERPMYAIRVNVKCTGLNYFFNARKILMGRLGLTTTSYWILHSTWLWNIFEINSVCPYINTMAAHTLMQLTRLTFYIAVFYSMLMQNGVCQISSGWVYHKEYY